MVSKVPDGITTIWFDWFTASVGSVVVVLLIL